VVVEGFLAEPIPDEPQPLVEAVIEGKGPLACQAIQAVVSPALPGPKKDFGVSAGPQGVRCDFELADQLPVVVNLTVEAGHVPATRGHHGLERGFRKIQNRQPTVAQAEGSLREDPLAVRAAVSDPVQHGLDHAPIIRRRVGAVYTRNAAHFFCVPGAFRFRGAGPGCIVACPVRGPGGK